MITPISTVNSRQNSYAYSNSFRSKILSKKITANANNDQFARSAMANIKLKFLAPLFTGIAALLGKELVYNENTGNLSEIHTKTNGVLIQSKYFYPNGNKVKEIDEYENGNIKKISLYKPDGKTLDWTVEYDKYQDVITYYSDRNLFKTVQIELNDGSNKKQIKHFDSNGRWIKTENYVNDVIIDKNEWFDDRDVTKKYVNGKLAAIKTEFRRGKIKYTVEDYDKLGKLIRTTAYKLNSDNELYIGSVTEYPDKYIMRTTHFDARGNVQYVEHKNLRTGKIERRYNTREVRL